MNFSFLDISIKFPHDLFSWNRIKSTFLVSWYVLWRLALIYFSVIVMVIGLLISGFSAESIIMHVKSLWLKLLWGLLITLAISFLNHKALYGKSYRSFKLTLNESPSPRFYSGYFWKRNILLNIPAIPCVFIEKYTPVIFIFYGALILISHICLHSGFWGVTTESK